MKKSTELRKKLNEVKNEIKSLQDNDKITEAHAKISEIENLNKEIKIQETLENMEEETIKNIEPMKTHENVNETVIFNKRLLGKRLTEAEKQHVENVAGSPGQIESDDERGGYLVPEEQGKQIEEFRRTKVALKPFTNVIPVNTITGKFPMGTDQKGMLENFEELNEIGMTEVTFTQQKWSMADYGKIIPLSNTLLEDAFVNITSYIGDQFVKMAVNTENSKILEVLKASKKKTGKEIDDIKTVLNVDLDPAISMNAIIITNQTGFDYMDKLKDKNGRDILSDSLNDATRKTFKGKEIIVLPDELLKATGNALPFIIGDLTQAVNFYDRKGVEIAVSQEAGFTKNATLMRVIERFDVLPYDKEAVIWLDITPAEETATK